MKAWSPYPPREKEENPTLKELLTESDARRVVDWYRLVIEDSMVYVDFDMELLNIKLQDADVVVGVYDSLAVYLESGL